MKVDFSIDDQKGDVLILLSYQHEKAQVLTQDNALKTRCLQEMEHYHFIGDRNELHAFYHAERKQVILLAGLGHSLKIKNTRFKETINNAIQWVTSRSFKDVSIALPAELTTWLDDKQVVQNTVMAVHNGQYQFNRYMTGHDDAGLSHLHIIAEDTLAKPAHLAEGMAIAEASTHTRDLVNTPANDLPPRLLAESAMELGKKYGFEVTVLDEAAIAKLGMHAFMAVAKASTEPPRLIVMRWKGQSADKPLGLVGKGVTYDTGGLSLKPGEFMEHMKSDMAGSATVIGAMCAIAKMQLPQPVTAVVAGCENNVAGNAYRPGDVINSMAGKTIEVLNTDAEGRLTLADAIHYSLNHENVQGIVDIATLTGAVKIALGDHRAAIVSHTDGYVEQLLAASTHISEPLWQLPLDDEYRSHVHSEIADLKNVGTARLAGTISAAAFIEAFTDDKPWAHLDIAGVAFRKSAKDYYGLGATGFGVSTLYHFVKGFAKA